MPCVDEIIAAANDSYAAAEHGSFRGMDSVLDGLAGSSSPIAVAWDLTLRALRWSFHPDSARAPEPVQFGHFIDQPDDRARQVAARACAAMERVCIATLDASGLATWMDVHSALASSGDDVALRSARLWHRLLIGDTTAEETAAKALFDEASRQRSAAGVIESTVLRALLALSVGKMDDAVELARRGSRMAQSECLPQLEYLANLTLARVRRYGGRPHLALHILAALARVAPPAWSGWIGWETLLGGGGRAYPSDSRSFLPSAPAMIAEGRLASFLDATRTGDREQFNQAAVELEQSASLWPDLAREIETLVAALDPIRPVPASTSSPCFYRGETATRFHARLHGIGISEASRDESDAAAVFVTATPGSSGRRFLRPGLAFTSPEHLLTRDSTKSGAGGVRTETAVAALALSGDAGVAREVFFQSVYGFPFVAHRHQAVLDVLCYRMRALLGDAGVIDRDLGTPEASPSTNPAGPSLGLTLTRPIIVADMRCALPVADRVLRALAKLGTSSASSAADSLRMPLRTVQAILQQLVAEGACSTERTGRHIAYRIEDTTFTEVTTV